VATDSTAAAAFYADFAGLAALKKSAAVNDPKAVREAARQFESLFTRMMLKSMRSASIGDAMFDSKETQFYRDLFDDQLAVQLSKGRGLGLADMLMQQLQRAGLVKEAGAGSSPGAAAGVPAQGAPASAAATTSSAAPVAGSPEDFVARMWPYARTAAKQLEVDPATLIAHAALETGWGRNVPSAADGSSSYNLFGIKAGNEWQGAAVGARTIEFEGGVAVNKVQRFRAYASPADSFKDYAALLAGSERYAQAIGTGTDTRAFAGALQRGGYATDPSYARKLAAVAERVNGLAAAQSLKVGADRPLTGNEV